MALKEITGQGADLLIDILVVKQLGRQHHQLAAGHQILQHLFAVVPLVGGEGGVDVVHKGYLPTGLTVAIQQLLPQGRLALGEHHPEVRQGAAVGNGGDGAAPEHGGEDGVCLLQFCSPEGLLPQGRYLHARMEGVGLVILRQHLLHRLAGLPV